MKNSRGFTLIEMLVVVLIIGILASVAIPQYFKVVEKARVSEAMSLAGAIRSAEERQLAKTSSYVTGSCTAGGNSSLSVGDLTSPCPRYFGVTIGAGTGGIGESYYIQYTRSSTNVSTRYNGMIFLVCQSGAIYTSNENARTDLLPDSAQSGSSCP